MGTKQNPGQFSCHERALPDEETFTLLARSPEFSPTVRFFANMRCERIDRGEAPVADDLLVDEALRCAKAGAKWRTANMGAWRDDRATSASLGKMPRDKAPSSELLRIACNFALDRLVELGDRHVAAGCRQLRLQWEHVGYPSLEMLCGLDE